MREALALNPDWIWTCDDDAIPETDSIIEVLSGTAIQRSRDLVAPIIVAPEDLLRLSFPFRNGLKRVWERNQIEAFEFIEGQAHLFNGTLFSVSMLNQIGLPDSRLFIRGDEQEFLFRIIKSGFKVGTTTNIAMIHPSGENELYPTLFGILRIPIPNSNIKCSYQIRNRGYLTRKYRRVDWAMVDFFRYVSFFLLRLRPQFDSFGSFTRIYLDGIMGDLDAPCRMLSENTWLNICRLTREAKK
jgi:rhamnopyranosyl-N-acetylglucosaminyl-diphospho-decaprenol beta-1,3/1,4-galactofuranosyltransferase